MSRLVLFLRSLPRRARKGELWCALMGMAVALSVGYSPADAPGRRYLVVGGVFFVLFVALSWLNGVLSARVDAEIIDKERLGILLLSQFSLALFALRLLVAEAVPEAAHAGLHLLSLLLLVSMVAKALVVSHLGAGHGAWATVESLLGDHHLLLASLCLTIPLVFAVRLLANRPFVVSMESPTGLMVGLGAALIVEGAVFVLVAEWLLRGSRTSALAAAYDLNSAFLLAGIPLSLMAMAVPIANELQQLWTTPSPRGLAIALVVGLVATALVLFVLQWRKRFRIRSDLLVHWLYFPTLIATLATFQTHRQTMELTTADASVLGELALPAQQLFQHRAIPLLDLQPVHGLADVLFQSLYSLLHGYSGLDMVIWSGWLPEVAGFLLIYGFLAVVTSPVLALLATVLLPVQGLIIPPYGAVLPTAILLVWVIRRPSFKRFLWLWLLVGGLMLWRRELGWVSLWALVLLVAAYVAFEYRGALMPALASISTVLGIVSMLLLVAEIFWDGDTYVALQAFWRHVQAASEARAEPPNLGVGSAGGVQLTLVLQRHLLPLAALICVLYFGLRKLVASGPFPDRSWAVLFVALFSLLMTLGPLRTPAARPPDPTLLLLTLALLPLYFVGRPFQPRMLGASSFFLAVAVLSAVIERPTTRPLGPGFRYFSLVRQGELFRFRPWEPGAQRVQFVRRSDHQLGEFLRAELEGRETFFDFSDTAVLYVLAGKRFPGQAIPSLRHLPAWQEQVMLSNLDAQRREGLLPVVIQRVSGGRDGEMVVPLAARAFRLAEFVNRHYLPHARVGPYQAWRSATLPAAVPAAPASPLRVERFAQQYPLGKLPYQWGRQAPWLNATRSEVIAVLLDEPRKVSPGSALELEIEDSFDRTTPMSLHLRARPLAARTKATLGVMYGSPASSFRFEVTPKRSPPEAVGEGVELTLREPTTTKDLQRVPARPDRLIFEATGADPLLVGFADTSPAPAADESHELWLQLRYRSSAAGPMQIFFASQTGRFRERESVRLQASADGSRGEPDEVTAPILGRQRSHRLTDLRLDPPPGSVFELLGVTVSRRRPDPDDYLLRPGIQWRWVSSEPRSITLRANAEVLVDSVYLRRAE